eukprot:symbB.v1.2.039137.t1/scaffold6366.1/size18706/3
MPRLHERQFRRALKELHKRKEAVVHEEEETLEFAAGGGSSPRSRGEPFPATGSGRCAGGVLVRTAQDLKSPEASSRLGFRATVRELDLVGTRLNFELVTGRGPKTGWVSIKVSGKDLLVRCGDPEVPSTCEATSENEEPPDLVAHEEEEDEVLSVDDEIELSHLEVDGEDDTEATESEGHGQMHQEDAGGGLS